MRAKDEPKGGAGAEHVSAQRPHHPVRSGPEAGDIGDS